MRTRIRVYIIYNTITIPQGEQTAGNCSTKIGELPERAEGYETQSEGYETNRRKQLTASYLLRFARPPTSGGQLHPAAVGIRRGNKPDGTPHLR